MSEKQILTITELNEYIKLILDNTPRLNDVWVKGEISNFTSTTTCTCWSPEEG